MDAADGLRQKVMKEHLRVAHSMIRYGGSFVKPLGQALLNADEFNMRKIKFTWPEYWAQYLRMSDTYEGDW